MRNCATWRWRRSRSSSGRRWSALEPVLKSLLVPRTRAMTATSSSRSAPARAATRPLCSPPTCSACTLAMPSAAAGRPKCSRQNETGIGGFKEVIFQVKGKGAYSRLKFESGVHRVQRVPATEAQGRIHTSTATVAVLAEVDEVEIDIPEKDIKMDVYRSAGRRRAERAEELDRRPPDAPPDRDRGAMPGRALAAAEPHAGDEHPARPAVRDRAGEAAGRARTPPAARRSAAASAPRRSAPTTSRSRG